MVLVLVASTRVFFYIDVVLCVLRKQQGFCLRKQSMLFNYVGNAVQVFGKRNYQKQLSPGKDIISLETNLPNFEKKLPSLS